MGRPPCCDKSNVKRGLWTPEEDAKILAYVSNHGTGNWTLVPKKAGLNRCGKSCRLRWTNYLRPDLKHDRFAPEEEELIIKLHEAIGSRWSLIAKRLPGRTDNDVKNYWNTKLRKKLQKMGIDPVTHKPFSQIFSDFGNISGISNTGNLNKSSNTSLMSEPDHRFSSSISTATEISCFKKTMHEQKSFHFSFNEVSSSCPSSSSSSSTTTLFSPLNFIIKKSESDFDEMLSPTISSAMAMTQNDLSSCNITSTGSNDRSVCDHGTVGNGLEENNNAADDHAAYSSSASSFVDGILDKDRELHSRFPQLLDPSFDYY
ncbi:hypothetical protein OIU84_029022 [Salix udensis]|uniref:Uncharacterized protein n=1 Tax=Salix udensis TaxID=889485 RepID=A0AAD6KDV7_9ROSI|nr:hypothetical protein OIU84_029022 [Salix udensis]